MKNDGKKLLFEVRGVLITVAAALLSALATHVFIYPAGFAALGLEGVATMLYEITGINAGYFNLLFNVPLLIMAWFILKRRYVIYTVLFTLLSSGTLILFEIIGFPQFFTDTDPIISAICAGALCGTRTGLMLKFGASTGGMDVVAGMIQSRRPHLNVERIISLLCYLTAAVSYFVYGNNLMSVLLSVLQMFVFDFAAAAVLKDSRNAIEVHIITKNPAPIAHDIIYELKHGATVYDGRGLYTDEPVKIIISIINIRQLAELTDILKRYPESFVYYDEVKGVRGNFRWRREDAVK